MSAPFTIASASRRGTTSVSTEGPDGSVGSTGAPVRVIQTIDHIEEIRTAWTNWRGHRDADIDVYRTVLGCSSDPATPHILVIERHGQPDAILVGLTTTSTLNIKVAYFTIPVARVRVLHFVYGGLLGNQCSDNSLLMINEIARSLRRADADVAFLSYVRTDAPLHQFATGFPSLLMRDPFPLMQSHWIMNLPESPEAVLEGLSKEHRKHLRSEARKFRAAVSESLTVRCFATPDQLAQLMRDVEQVAATTYQRGLGVGFSDTRQIRELLKLEADKGWLRGYVLYVGECPYAFWIGCVYNGVFLSEYLGHDPAHAKYSPGTYLLVQVMEALCREGVTKIDLGIGETLYKQRFGNLKWDETALYLFAPTVKGLQVKALRASAAFISHIANKLLRRTTIAARLKKAWRKHLMRADRP